MSGLTEDRFIQRFLWDRVDLSKHDFADKLAQIEAAHTPHVVRAVSAVWHPPLQTYWISQLHSDDCPACAAGIPPQMKWRT